MPADVTLIDGRTFPDGSYLVRNEREVLEGHVTRMWEMTKPQRQAHLDRIQRSQGLAWRRAVEAKFTAEWNESRKPK